MTESDENAQAILIKLNEHDRTMAGKGIAYSTAFVRLYMPNETMTVIDNVAESLWIITHKGTKS